MGDPTASTAVVGNPLAVAQGSARTAGRVLLPPALTAAAIGLAVFCARDASLVEWTRFAGLVVLGFLVHTLIARADPAPAGHATAVVVLPAAAVLLPFDVAVSVALSLSVPRWLFAPRGLLRARAVELGTEVAATGASGLAAAAGLALASTVVGPQAACGIAALAACVTFVGAGQLPRLLARRDDAEDDGPETLDLRSELLLAVLGAALAAAFLTSPWLVPFATAPLLLLTRWFEIPKLEHQARRDAKTGLFNARHFELAVAHELEKARVARTPASVLLADLDLLREINNAHGHLAGDAVLRGVADILRDQLRARDIPARFGGEEFAVLLPGTSCRDALEIAERLRRTVADACFTSGTADGEVRATVSIGVASYPEDGSSEIQLIHAADLAVYRAKLQGRNRVQPATGETIAAPVISATPVRLVGGSRRDDRPGDSSAARAGLPWPLALGDARLTIAIVGATALAALAASGIAHASYISALLAPAIAGLALLMHRGAARAQADRRSAAVANERAERLRRGADTLSSLNRSLERANRLLRERSAAAMETLTAVIDARDAHTAGHSRRVQKLALLLGQELGLSEAELEVLGQAARFHDVGKLAVPEAVLLKPSELSDLDWAVMRRHPEEGAKLIGRLGFLEDALPAILHHHERYDGSGYPEGLAGDDIPLGARIIHLSDALDAMLTARPYRPALDPLDAVEQVRAGAGVQFCPRCVDALDRVMLAEFRQGADVPRELLAS